MRALAVLALLALGVYGCGSAMVTTGAYRYRITLAVDTPEGRREGSSVVEIESVWYGALPLPGNRSALYVTGEAVVVDLGARGTLFGLLQNDERRAPGDPPPRRVEGVPQIYGDYPPNVVWEAFPWSGGPGGQATPPAIRYYEALRAKAELAPGLRPLMVRFRDPRDPASVEHADDLASAFGAGVRLASVGIEMVPVGRRPYSVLPAWAAPKDRPDLTGVPITNGVVVARLPWLEELKRPPYRTPSGWGRDSAPGSLGGRLGYSSFKRETDQR